MHLSAKIVNYLSEPVAYFKTCTKNYKQSCNARLMGKQRARFAPKNT